MPEDTMHAQFDAAAIVEFHDENLSRTEWLGGAGRPVPHGTWLSIDANHRFNGLLWDEEDRARLSGETAGAMIDRLLAEKRQGQAYFKVYHQLTMYNDPSLDPYLYGLAGAGVAQ
jgi:hypothetical protein